MHETIRIGAMSVTFLKTRHETDGAFDLFELTIPPLVHVPIPHIHRKYDETIFGLDGNMTWTLRDEPTPVVRQRSLHPARRPPLLREPPPHHRPNPLSPDPRRRRAGVLSGNSQPLHARTGPDLASIASTMSRYGIIPITHSKYLTPTGPEA